MASACSGVDSDSYRRSYSGEYRGRTRRRGTYHSRVAMDRGPSKDVDGSFVDDDEHFTSPRDFEASDGKISLLSLWNTKMIAGHSRGRSSSWVSGGDKVREKYRRYGGDHTPTENSEEYSLFYSENVNIESDFSLEIERDREQRKLVKGRSNYDSSFHRCEKYHSRKYSRAKARGRAKNTSSHWHDDNDMTNKIHHSHRARRGRGRVRNSSSFTPQGTIAPSNWSLDWREEKTDVGRMNLFSQKFDEPSTETTSISDASPNLHVVKSQRPNSKFSGDHKTTTGKVKRYTTVSQFLQFHNAPPETIAAELLHDLKSFQKVILNSKKVGEKRDDMFKILLILSKLTEVDRSNQSVAIRVLAETLNSRSYQFCFKLQQYVQAIRTTADFTFVISLFDAFLSLLPSSWEVLPIETLKNAISSYALSLSTNTTYLSMIAAYQDAKQNVTKNVTKEILVKKDYSEYRNIPILPTTSEINEFLPPKLHPSIVEGCYESWEHYYDIQFKLLREDFVAPLRRGVCGFRKGLRGLDISDVRVYYNVTFTGLEFSADGIIISVQLDSSKFQRINWEHSKRLIYGSLLCFSYNNFESVIFASVAGRDAENLKKGLFTVKMESNMNILELILNENDLYTMIESQAHYETYYHVLCSLQNAEVHTMPFTDILIDSKSCIIQPPLYLSLTNTDLIDHPKRIFDMKDALGMIDCHSDVHCFDISKPECWPHVGQVQLDQSQLDAMKMALTQKVSVIQGPPGTGKTYIGVKIVQALLTNRHVWDSARNSPILVVCYTNHALDQFLEEIIDLNTFSVVRIGGRCQNEKVIKFNIKNQRAMSRNIYLAQVKRAGESLDYKFRVVQEKIEPKAKDLIEFIAPIHKAQLCAFVKGTSKGSKDGKDKPSYRQQRGKQSTDINDYGADDDFHDAILHEDVTALQKVFDEWRDEPKILNEKELIAENENKMTAKSTSKNTSRESKQSDDEFLQSIPESSDKGNDSTVNVLGEAEIAEAERMIDQPAAIFKFEVADELNRPNSNTNSNRDIRGFTHDAVNRIKDIFKLSKCDQNRLYNYWKKQCIAKFNNGLHADFEEYLTLCKQHQEATQEEHLYILEKVELIGMTTTGAAKYQHIIQKLKPKIIIVEEAAEVLESHVISCLTAATQQLILIGDHKQLRPKPNEYHLARDCNLDVSLFERLIRAGISHATLEIQHRMRPEIAGLVSPHIYPKLLNHESVLQYENIQGVTTNMYFFHHEYPKVENDELKSHSNEDEAKLVVGLCRYFLKQGYSSSKITVLTTYTSQLMKLKMLPKSEFEGVRVTAVDNFQGEENDIILLSLVRSNTEGRVGFLNVENRVCVAISRAKKGFFCFGNFTLLRKSSVTWKHILHYLEDQNKLGSCLTLYCFNHPDYKTEVHTVDDFKKVPQGGCDRPCDVRLECGHACKMYCHPMDHNHEYYICEQPCAKKCEEGHLCNKLCSQGCDPCKIVVQKVHAKCGRILNTYCCIDPDHKCNYPCEKECSTNPDSPHKCEKVCYLPCGDCEVPVLKTLPQCGHNKLMECYRNPADYVCQELCKRKVECGHFCAEKCGMHCTLKCKVKVKKILQCNHSVFTWCSKPIDAVICPARVKKVFPVCGHSVILRCSKPISDAICQVEVEKEFSDCGHSVVLPCSKPISNATCQVEVEKTFSDCEHSVVLPCSKPISDTICQVEVEKVFPDCGHSVVLPCSKPIDDAICQVEVEKTFSDCEHSLLLPCSKPISDTICQVEVEKVFPDCEHSLLLPCSKPISDAICKVEVQKAFSDCGHSVVLPCSKPISKVYCQEMVQKTLACGHIHETFTKCSKRVECKTQIRVTLNCGHVFEGPCNKRDEKCKVLSLKQFSACGHEIKLPCCEDLPTQCVERCNTTLLCGHQCTGNCSECYQGKMHRPCRFQMAPLPCGHPTKKICTSITFPQCHYKCTYSCVHRKVCTHHCSQPCNPCRKYCSWKCPHYKCTKLCYEMCNRPRCNHPCKEILQCKHPCIGICGEPCPRVCRICKKQKNKFYKLCVSTASTKNEIRYIQLSCNHLFEVKELDQLLDKQFEGNTNMKPLVCPSCEEEIHSSSRYGNLVRKKKETIRKIHDIMNEPATVEAQEAVIEKVLSHFVPGVEYTARNRNKIEQMLKSKRKGLPVVFKNPKNYLFFASSFQCTEVSILDNEIDQYLLLKRYERVCEQYPDLSALLQELLTFFIKTPPSIQKSKDVLCERQRIFLLWIISCLTSVTVPLEHDVIIKQIKETLIVHDPKLTQTTLAGYYESLQGIIDQKLGRHFKFNERHMQSSRMSSVNGIWKICLNGHVYCEPSGLTDDEWDCPDCPQ